MRVHCLWFALLLKFAEAVTCNFTLNELEFDLCPLFSSSGNEQLVSFAKETPPTFTTYRYALGMGVPLKHDYKLPSELQCPEGTWICLTVINTRPSHPSEPERYLQVVPVASNEGLSPKAKLLPKPHAEDVHEPLLVTLHGGLYSGASQKASFQFVCSHSDEAAPEFLWQFNGTHAFSWRTKHACPKVLPPGAPGPGSEEPDADPPAVPPVDPDTDVQDPEPTRRPSLTSTSALYILLWALALGFLLRVLYPSLSRWIRRVHLFSSRATRGYQRSSSVKWAAEEALEEYEISDASEGSGEETPLTPNSKTTFTSNQYGSAG